MNATEALPTTANVGYAEAPMDYVKDIAVGAIALTKLIQRVGRVDRTGPEILTLAEAATLLQVTVDGLRTDAESGRVPGRQVAGEWRFGRDALLGWVSRPAYPVESRSQSLLSAAGSMADEPQESFEAFLENIRAARDEVDRVTCSGKYAPE